LGSSAHWHISGLGNTPDGYQNKLGMLHAQNYLWLMQAAWAWCQQWVHCATDCLGLGFGGFWTLASAHVLCPPIIEV